MFKRIIFFTLLFFSVNFFAMAESQVEETLQEEASRRMPGVLYSISLPTLMVEDDEITFDWVVEGYHEEYSSFVLLCNLAKCSDPNDLVVSPLFGELISTSKGGASYYRTPDGPIVSTKRYKYRASFTVPKTNISTIKKLQVKVGWSISEDKGGRFDNSGPLTLIYGGNSSKFISDDGRYGIYGIYPKGGSISDAPQVKEPYGEFNITYGDVTRRVNDFTIDLDLNLDRTDAGVITLYRKRLRILEGGKIQYRYEFTLSSDTSTSGINDVSFIALLDDRDKIIAAPVQVERHDKSVITPLSGRGIEYKAQGGANFNSYPITDKLLPNSIRNQVSTLGLGLLSEQSLTENMKVGDVLSKLNLFDTAAKITTSTFRSIDSTIAEIRDRPELDQSLMMLPSSVFSNDMADINEFKTYQIALPLSSTSSPFQTIVGIRFSIEVEEDDASESFPRFHINWRNNNNLDAAYKLEIGTDRLKNLRAFDTYIRAAKKDLFLGY